jgi:hypothetical protein
MRGASIVGVSVAIVAAFRASEHAVTANRRALQSRDGTCPSRFEIRTIAKTPVAAKSVAVVANLVDVQNSIATLSRVARGSNNSARIASLDPAL